MDLTYWLTTLGVSGATAIGALWLGSKYLADAWLKARFDRALEAFRSEKARELEALRFESSRLLDRATKIHGREIEILPTLWDKMTSALSATSHLTSRNQIVPATDRMSGPQLLSFLNEFDLESWEKQELLNLPQKQRDEALWDKLQWQRFGRADKLHGEFQNYYIANSVFLPEDLRVEIMRLSKLNSDALEEFTSHLRGETERGPEGFKNRDRLAAELEAGFETVLKLVQGYLWVAGDAGKDLLAQRDRVLEGEA